MNNLQQDYFIIYNPISGNNKGIKIIKLVEEIFTHSNKTYQIFKTDYAKHAIEICKELNLKLYKNIIAIGGDGTFNEVINGILLNSQKNDIPALGFLPGGTGNSFMHDLKATNINKALENILKNRIKMIDIMQLKYNNEIHFAFNIVGWGLVTDILKLSEKIRFLGGIRYNLASFYYIFLKHSRYAKILIENKQENGEYLFILNMNTIYTGRGMKAAPNAILNDGYFDCILVKNNVSRLQLLLLMIKIFSGSHIKSKYVRYTQIKSIKIEPHINESLNIDGEIKGNTPVEIIILEKKIKILW